MELKSPPTPRLRALWVETPVEVRLLSAACNDRQIEMFPPEQATGHLRPATPRPSEGLEDRATQNSLPLTCRSHLLGGQSAMMSAFFT